MKEYRCYMCMTDYQWEEPQQCPKCGSQSDISPINRMEDVTKAFAQLYDAGHKHYDLAVVLVDKATKVGYEICASVEEANKEPMAKALLTRAMALLGCNTDVINYMYTLPADTLCTLLRSLVMQKVAAK